MNLTHGHLCRGTLAAFALVAATALGCGGAATPDVGPVDMALVDVQPDVGIDAPRADSGPIDRQFVPVATAPIFVHDKETLYQVAPPDFEVRVIGPFDITEKDSNVTDLAVTAQGEVYVITNTALYRADATTGKATYVGPVNGEGNVALTFLPSGELLASDQAGGVRRIDPLTGTATEIGAYGDGLATAGDLVAVADGTLFGISDQGADDANVNNILLQVDPTTGRATRIGPIGYGTVWGIAFTGGKVYAFTRNGEIIEIDPDTGSGTLKGTLDMEFWGAGVTPLVMRRPQG